MNKALKWIGIALLAAFVIIQFFRPDLDNPASIAGQSIWSDPTMTPKVEQILRRSCNDCHSIHSFKSVKAQLKTATDMDTCSTCHPPSGRHGGPARRRLARDSS